MYNLLVSADSDSWNGEPFILEFDRFLEHTDNEIKDKYKKVSDADIKEIIRFPCIFSYEISCTKDPLFGVIQEVIFRKKIIRIRYEIIPLKSFLTSVLLRELEFELDITSKWEFNRTHWAIKNVDLPKELYAKGIILPEWAFRERKTVDITKHNFDVALSFPGEIRDFILPIVAELEKSVGPNSYFYDNNYKAQLARPALDLLLQNIYKDRSKLIVVFLCEKYQEKNWCGIEFNAIRQIIFAKQHDKIMYIKMDNGLVEGVFQTDGYIDGRIHNAKEIAEFIKTRIELLTTD